jgi:hypothetical protein
MTKSELWNYYIKRLVRTGITDAGYSSAAPTSHSCNPCNPRFSLFCSCLFVLIRGSSYFLYAGTSGKTGGCNSPSSSSSLGFTGNPPGVTSRAVTKITKLRLMC